MKKVGFIGWRGMVGSVLMQRMHDNNDFDDIQPVFFSTSQVGSQAPKSAKKYKSLQDAYELERLFEMDVIITCQGSDYTQSVLIELEQMNWPGYWIDAASFLRMDPDSIIVLDPINRPTIDQAIDRGVKRFVGGNCTVSLLMLAIHGLLDAGVVDWINVMSYQAVSGAGAKAMAELMAQLDYMQTHSKGYLDILKQEQKARQSIQDKNFPCYNLPQALAFNVLPWIDKAVADGQTKEEWKAQAEMSKILNDTTTKAIAIDGICVRVPTLRAHSQALTIQLNKDVSLADIKSILSQANPWVRFVENDDMQTYQQLTPLSVAGTLDIAVGRLKKSLTAPNHIHLFTVGDQLLWGAAEPLRRMLKILLSA
ncbi:aspartate-semialdehyde dehydrogenase [Facilibium subflavum]|uniref:aspartate-semialdehyde dehydrogenase n=1 Tax=Facilibium subflavum TaxID=2219058 RepID=UPI000E64D7AC|nr:aspartate-semialdehyde dehydrogenase [Facilibium subflavum]